MKVKLTYSLTYSVQNIDLENYSYEKDQTWESLSDEQRHEITDILLDETVIHVAGETIN